MIVIFIGVKPTLSSYDFGNQFVTFALLFFFVNGMAIGLRSLRFTIIDFIFYMSTGNVFSLPATPGGLLFCASSLSPLFYFKLKYAFPY